LPSSLIAIRGLKLSRGQPWTPNGLDTDASAPSTDVRLASTVFGAQLVGLRMKPGRFRSTRTCRIRSSTPSRILGNGSDLTAS
jgi:hypothetical protein